MSNGLSGCTQYMFNAQSDRIERTRQAKKEAFEKYIISYVECISKKACTCSVCKTENAIKLVKAVRTSTGVEETWKCASCGRIVNRSISNEDFSQWLNEDRQKTA
jgi:transposase-like protein